MLTLRERAGPETGNATSRFPLRFKRLEPGETWEVAYLAFLDVTTGPTSLDVYLEGHGYKHYIAQQQPTNANYIYFLDRPFRVEEGETLVVEFVGGGASDVMEAWATGLKDRA